MRINPRFNGVYLVLWVCKPTDLKNEIMRSITQILLEAEKSETLQALIDLWNEIVSNKKKYTLTQIWFANEKIRERSLIVDGEDIEKGKFYYALKEMDKS